MNIHVITMVVLMFLILPLAVAVAAAAVVVYSGTEGMSLPELSSIFAGVLGFRRLRVDSH